MINVNHCNFTLSLEITKQGKYTNAGRKVFLIVEHIKVVTFSPFLLKFEKGYYE